MYALCAGVRALTTLRRVAICACPSTLGVSSRACRMRPSKSPGPICSPCDAFCRGLSSTLRAISQALSGPVEDHDIAMRVSLDAEPVFDQRQMGIEFTEQA